MDTSEDAKRKRLREKIRSKRDQRVGGDKGATSSNGTARNNPLGSITDPVLQKELSERVETELRKMFGSDPEAMSMAREFIDNPMSALSEIEGGTPLTAEELSTMGNIMKMPRVVENGEGMEDDDEEAPPGQ